MQQVLTKPLHSLSLLSSSAIKSIQAIEAAEATEATDPTTALRTHEVVWTTPALLQSICSLPTAAVHPSYHCFRAELDKTDIQRCEKLQFCVCVHPRVCHHRVQGSRAHRFVHALHRFLVLGSTLPHGKKSVVPSFSTSVLSIEVCDKNTSPGTFQLNTLTPLLQRTILHVS